MEFIQKDKNGNSLNGRVIAHKTKRSLIKIEERLIVTKALDDAIIIEIKSVLLIANKKNSQDVNEIAQTLNSEG